MYTLEFVHPTQRPEKQRQLAGLCDLHTAAGDSTAIDSAAITSTPTESHLETAVMVCKQGTCVPPRSTLNTESRKMPQPGEIYYFLSMFSVTRLSSSRTRKGGSQGEQWRRQNTEVVSLLFKSTVKAAPGT